MADVEKTEFTFPDEQENKDVKAAPKDDLAIEVVDDVPEVDRNRKPMAEPPRELTDDELNKYDESVKSRIKHFSKGYHEERRAKEAALREQNEALRIAKALVEENQRLRGSLSEGHTALIDQAKKNANTEYEAAKRKYKEAADAFDSDAMLAAQEEMTSIRLRADKLENFKPAPLQSPEIEVQTEQRVNKPQLDDRLVEWRDRNKWFGENKRMTTYALGLHEDLLEEGIQAGSDKYYERLDSDLRERFPEQFGGNDADAKTQPRTRSNVVAPATRGTAARKVVLTQTQVSIAKRLGVPLELYARKVAEEMRK